MVEHFAKQKWLEEIKTAIRRLFHYTNHPDSHLTAKDSATSEAKET